MNATVYNAMIPKNISKLIDQNGLKQNAVARKAGFKEQQFCDLLKGRRIIKAIDVVNIFHALGVTPNDLFAIDKEKREAS